MSGKTVFMFSGQGSQYYQMGRQLYDDNPVFRRWMTQLDGLAFELGGERIAGAIYAQPKSAPFERTAVSHPAIFMVEYALAQCLIEAGVKPDMTLGASMGSFAAAAVAGYIDVHAAMAAVLAQARAFEATCPAGGMLAVLAPAALYQEPFMRQHSDLAGVNFDGHFAVAGDNGALALIAAELGRRGLSHQRLAVSFAFHSPAIERAEPQFSAHARGMARHAGRLPLVCCEQAATLRHLAPDFFWRVVRQPMRVQDTIAHLEREGRHRYVDVGPAGTMATFVKYTLPPGAQSSVHSLLTPFGRDSQNLAALVAAH